MASAARTDNKRRIEALEDQVKKLQDEQQAARRRLDRVEKSTQLVLENSAKVEELYKTATETRNFRDLSKETGKAILQEVGTQVKLPWLLPENTPEQWQNIGEETRMHNLETVRKWWALAERYRMRFSLYFPTRQERTGNRTLGIGHVNRGTLP